MTEEERQEYLLSLVWYWFPVRWWDSGSLYTITDSSVTGDLESGGLDIYASKDDGDPVLIQFLNDNCYGGSALTVSAARAAIVAAF